MSTPISEATFVVVDTETTGTAAGSGRIIEIAAVKVRGGEVVDRFSQLINPQRSVPHFITKLTGISTAMLYNQPVAAEVMPLFMDFLGDGVFVAHNLQFDRQFVDAELTRHGLPILKNHGLCTLRLARRLLSGLRSKGLASVSDFYGIKINGHHRAGADADATAQILLRFLAQLRSQHNIQTAEEALALQFQSYSRPRQESKHVRRIREEILPIVPETPGVYFMKNGRNQTLYIGKAKNLRSRVRSYFSGIEGHTPRLRELIEKVRNITWAETSCELSALLMESRLIKEHKPAFNRAQRWYRSRPFIRLASGEAFPRVSLTNHPMDDGAEYFGPLAGRNHGELVVEVIDRFFSLRECNDTTFRRREPCMYSEMERCKAPCRDEGMAAQYAEEVQRVRDFLIGNESGILDRIQEAMKRSAARLEFEQAATYRDWHRKLEHMLAKQRCIASPVLEHNAVLALTHDADAVQLFFVRFGRHLATLKVPRTIGREEEARLLQQVGLCFDPGANRPERYHKPEVDEVRILAHWMYIYRESLRKITWGEEDEPTAFVDRIKAEIAKQAAAPVEAGEDSEDDEEVPPPSNQGSGQYRSPAPNTPFMSF